LSEVNKVYKTLNKQLLHTLIVCETVSLENSNSVGLIAGMTVA